MRKPQAAEHEIQALILEALRFAGFEPFHTTAFRQKGGSGVSKGVPDILVPIPCVGLYLGIEVKRPGLIKWSSPEQYDAHLKGYFVVAQCLEDVLRALVSLCNRITASETLALMVQRFGKIVEAGGSR